MLNCRPPPVVYVMSSERAVPVMFMRASRKPLVRPPDGIDMKKRIWLAPVTVYGRIVMLTLDACHSGSGADEMKSLDWASSMLPEMMAALPPSRPDVMVPASSRSEEHTSELQSRRDLVCRRLLEKKKDLLRIPSGV